MKWFWLLLFVVSCSKMRKDSSQQEDAADTNSRDRWEEETEEEDDEHEDEEEEDDDEEEDTDDDTEEDEEGEPSSPGNTSLNNEERGTSLRGRNNRRIKRGALHAAAGGLSSSEGNTPSGKGKRSKETYTITVQDTTDSGLLHSIWFMAYGKKGATKNALLQINSQDSQCVLLKKEDFSSLSVLMDFEVENSKKEQAVCHNFAPSPTYSKCTPNGMAGSFILKIANDCPGFCLLKRDEWKYTFVPGNSAGANSIHCSRLQ